MRTSRDMLARHMELATIFVWQNEKNFFLADTSLSEDADEVLHTHTTILDALTHTAQGKPEQHTEKKNYNVVLYKICYW
jgi:hypothetical protein